ncbi:cleavage stimulation factor subunit 1-like isoform X3 [Eriocheir sinensis]|uniref:cleavage stimulation factor subunit 1-like isoform X3 n=1 Tax=Eriocheir sinensis TaxID=95602 RepID=UPI0021C802A0|nr:cleavage stimulation factor subunit 1-like isoform X3 [Eriocheir sinensis]XP_050705125.1 cleavage stimulation factor subunit 1-like isoform X3 [Eriocheir sinensis]XP_050705126.1 cleavage stimulation factor subunit 1-like isoform X3 [Eriocheir sinensis]
MTSAPEPAMYETAYVTSHKDKSRAAAFSMDGSLVAMGSVDVSIKYILSSGLDSIVKLWELSTGRCLIGYTGAGSVGHNGPVQHMVHSPCSPAFITCSDDYRARFWYRRNVH